MIQCWRLDGARQTLVLTARSGRLAEVIHWGARLPDSEDLAALAKASVMDVTGGMLDQVPPLSLCPEATRSFPGQAGLVVADSTGATIQTDFRFVRDETSGGLQLIYADPRAGLELTFSFALDADTNVVTAQTRLVATHGAVRLHWLAAPVVPAPQSAAEMLDFGGRWCGEFQILRTPWNAGARLRESRAGRTDHSHFPGLIVPARGATNTQGTVWAWHYGWSGGHRMIAEELPDGRRQVQFGNAAGSEIAIGTEFQSAPLYLGFSDSGLNGTAAAFQRHLRDRIVPWVDAAPRKVHYNCWEAVYFDHDLPTLKDIASRAAALGAERFVLDDGWFGQRDDDTSSLGDWAIDARKWPDGLGPLIDHVHAENMTFGLWFEPEMVNRNSDLARAHSDWILGPEDQIEGRQQRVLNMANPKVRAHLYDRISTILRDNAIDYVKWDHNRVLPMPDAAQTRGTYALLDQLRADFPKVEFETCASGGGRIDFGILARTQRVWLSDSNDALERLRIQHDAALFLPAAVTGSHVGPRKCHTSGRVIDIRFRAWVAAQRQMGFEMDPRELTPDEAAVLTRVTQWWKDNRDWRMAADILRLDCADPSVTTELQLSVDKTRFVVFAGQTATSAQICPRPLPLTGLDPAAHYRVSLINADEAPNLSRGAPALKSQDLTLSGAYLMHNGLTLPWRYPETMWVVEGSRA